MSSLLFHIDKNDTVSKIQERFSDLYPFLRIIFFTNEGNCKKITDRCTTFFSGTKMSEIKAGFQDGDFEITDTLTPSEFENKLYELFGICAQISGPIRNRRPETSSTKQLTLREQNALGKKTKPGHRCLPFVDVPYGA
jgi:hypothetical protein